MNSLHVEKQMQTLCVYMIVQFIVLHLPIAPVWMLVMTIISSYCLKKRVDYVKEKYDDKEDEDDWWL